MTDYTKQVIELNAGDEPMVNSDYYSYLLGGGWVDNRIECKVNYLADRFGFIRGTDKISEHCIKVMNWIGEQYFHNEILTDRTGGLYSGSGLRHKQLTTN